MTDLVVGTGQVRWVTAVSSVEPDLLYRGYRVDDLAERVTFLETAYLLLTGELPTQEQVADWQALMLGGMTLPANVQSWLKRVPATASLSDVLLGVLGRVRLMDAPPEFLNARDLQAALPQWLGFLTAVLAARYRLTHGELPLEPHDELGLAGNLGWLLHGRAAKGSSERSLETLLILLAEHGLTPATISIRIAAVTGADWPAALMSGAAAVLSGQAVMDAQQTLQVLSDVKTVERASTWVEQRLEQDLPIPGFGHRIYRVGDPRTDLVASRCRQVAEQQGRIDREDVASAIEQAVWDQHQKLPNVRWPAARLLDYLRIEESLFGPLFLISRVAGWAAHYLEQRQSGNELSAAAQYIGPGQRSFANG